MGDLQFDESHLEEIANRLDLRLPNKEAVGDVIKATSQHYDVEELPSPFECIVDSATGVGKTFVMAGLIEYLAGSSRPARNFLLLAPGRTIRDKTTKNFTPGNPKSLTAAMKSRPFLVTKENFKSPATFKAMKDPAVTKVYVFTVQALTSATGDGRETHEFQETLGGSFYDYLGSLDDLVVFADEQHCYRGAAFSNTIQALNPELVVGLTATPDKKDESLVAYRYPLAAAIADRIVKIPILVGRRDDRNDDQTKLLDGVTLLRYKEQALAAYCADNELDRVNPVMLVIARDTTEAEEYRKILDSVGFDNGAWVGKTLLVHSNLTSDEKEQALADLDAVEDPSSPVRIIINVAMLKEGWDVKNVYVIASMRASVSDVMTEQTLGRGMRLPFGRYTGEELLDSVEVLAHEKYEDLLKKRSVLNQSFINFRTRMATRTLPNGQVVVRRTDDEVDLPILLPATIEPEQDEPPVDIPTATPSIVDVETRTKAAGRIADQTAQKATYEPLPDRATIYVPRIEWEQSKAEVSLNAIDLDQYRAFEMLGKALTADYSDELKRTKIVGRVTGDKAVLDTETASGSIQAALALDIPMETSRSMLVRYVMTMPEVKPTAPEAGAAQRIVDTVVAAMGDDAAVYLSAYGERCGQRLQAAIRAALKSVDGGEVTFNAAGATLVAINKVREATKKAVAGHADGAFDKSVAFNGWARNLYSHAWFDTTPEYRAANAIDAGKYVIVWARLHINDVKIQWNREGRNYNPDFVVIEEAEGKRIGWLVETKGMDRIDSHEVASKRRAARLWANTVNSFGVHDVEWRYLLLSERDVDDAQGSWEFMKEFGN